MQFATEISVADLCSNSPITLNDIREATKNDPELRLLASKLGFQTPTTPQIHLFANTLSDELWIQNDVIMFRNRIVIPKGFHTQILQLLDSAH